MLSRFETFIRGITEIDLYWHRIATAVMKRYGLKGNYAIYFTRLSGHPTGIPAAQLAVECGKDKADVSRDMAVLENAGLVARNRVGGNAYRARILLTESGRKLTAEIIRIAERAVDCIGHELADDDRECFYRVLCVITANLHALSETGFPDAANTENG